MSKKEKIAIWYGVVLPFAAGSLIGLYGRYLLKKEA